MDRLRKQYSHLAEGWFLARKAACALSGYMATDSADYYILVNEWVWSKSRDCLLRPGVDMGAVLESEALPVLTMAFSKPSLAATNVGRYIGVFT